MKPEQTAAGNPKMELPADVTLDKPISPGQIDVVNKERIKHQNTIVKEWKNQQEQDRRMRKTYANWLLVVMSAQMVAINVIFVLIGTGCLKFEAWTAKTFVMAVFAEVASLVLLVVKYLFPATSDKSLDLMDRLRARDLKR